MLKLFATIVLLVQSASCFDIPWPSYQPCPPESQPPDFPETFIVRDDMDYSSGYYVSWVRSERSQAEALIQEPFGSTSIIKTLRLYGADPKEYKIEYQGPRSTSTDVLDLREYTITGCTVFSLSPEQAQNYPGNYFQWLKDPETLQCGADDFYSVYLWRKDDSTPEFPNGPSRLLYSLVDRITGLLKPFSYIEMNKEGKAVISVNKLDYTLSEDEEPDPAYGLFKVPTECI